MGFDKTVYDNLDYTIEAVLSNMKIEIFRQDNKWIDNEDGKILSDEEVLNTLCEANGSMISNGSYEQYKQINDATGLLGEVMNEFNNILYNNEILTSLQNYNNTEFNSDLSIDKIRSMIIDSDFCIELAYTTFEEDGYSFEEQVDYDFKTNQYMYYIDDKLFEKEKTDLDNFISDMNYRPYDELIGDCDNYITNTLIPKLEMTKECEQKGSSILCRKEKAVELASKQVKNKTITKDDITK